MHEALQPPKLEKVAPKPIREKRSRVDMVQVTPEQIQLFAAKDSLEKEIAELQDLYDLAPEGEGRNQLAEDIKKLEGNREVVLESLGKARPDEYGTEAAFEKMLKDRSPAEKRKMVEAKEDEKNNLEDESSKLKGKLRIANAELKKIVGKDVKRSGELEQQIRETELVLGQNEKRRVEAWKALKDLDPKSFGADADLEIAEAAREATDLKKATEEEIDDVLSALHENIDKS